ncbi:MAG TPA: M36 family metallopeptidase, partial [Solirubrobacteraceae bacterium]
MHGRSGAGRVAMASMVAAVIAGAAPAVAPARVQPRAQARNAAAALPFFDSRAGAVAAARSAAPRTAAGLSGSARTRDARAGLRRRLGGRAILDVDPLTGSVRSLVRLDGALAGPAAGEPTQIARGFVRRNAAALGLDGADVDRLEPVARTAGAGGLTVVRFGQSAGGIPAFDNGVRVGLDRAGRVLTVSGSPRHGLRTDGSRPRLDARQALARLMDDVGVRRDAAVTAGPRGQRSETRFSTGDTARLVLFGARDVRLAWHLSYRAASTAVYDAVVDAATGDVLYRANLVKFAADASVWQHYPGAPKGGTAGPVDLQARGYLPAGATRLDGPFARTYSDLNDDDQPQAREEVGRNGSGSFEYPFTGRTHASGGCSATALCVWDHEKGGSWRVNRQQDAVQAHFFVSNYHDHLAGSAIRFDAQSGNFEDGDRVMVNTLDGAETGGDGFPDGNHIDNANMETPADGDSPRMQMYLFSDDPDLAPFRDISGSDDAAVIYHEYTHGLSGRLVTNDDGTQALNTAHAGAMGEAWSDWYALDYLDRHGLRTDDPNVMGDVYLGEYTDDAYGLIRSEAIDCPVGADAPRCPGGAQSGAGGFSLGDFGRVSFGPEVHADGEIWAQTLWDLRRAFVAKSGSVLAGS